MAFHADRAPDATSSRSTWTGTGPLWNPNTDLPWLPRAGRHDRHLRRRLARHDEGLAAIGREREAGSVGDTNGLTVVRRPDVDRAQRTSAVPALIEQHGVGGGEAAHVTAFAPGP